MEGRGRERRKIEFYIEGTEMEDSAPSRIDIHLPTINVPPSCKNTNYSTPRGKIRNLYLLYSSSSSHILHKSHKSHFILILFHITPLDNSPFNTTAMEY